MDRWTDRQMDKYDGGSKVYGWMDGCNGGSRVDGWTDGLMDVQDELNHS